MRMLSKFSSQNTCTTIQTIMLFFSLYVF